MPNGQIGSVPVVHGDRWPTALASLAVGVAFFGLWFWLLRADCDKQLARAYIDAGCIRVQDVLASLRIPQELHPAPNCGRNSHLENR